jgi:hypothetical protein
VFGTRYYAREDDPLREPLLGEGKALRELVGRPLIHGALPHSGPPEASEQWSAAVVTLAAVWAAGGGRWAVSVRVGAALDGGPQVSEGRRDSRREQKTEQERKRAREQEEKGGGGAYTGKRA